MGPRAVCCLLFVVASACRSAPSQPVPITGAPSAIQSLVGEWDGSYEADDGSRTGSIDFHLRAGSDTAFGDVVMIPRGWERPVTPEDRPAVQSREVIPPRTLTIRFVEVGGDQISGELDRYRDPDCGCLLRTVFEGQLSGNNLTGRYLSYHQEGGPPVSGRWQAVRKAPAP
jgi:hypothetical protein